MELQKTPEQFREFFLLAFTRELIKNYIKDDILKLKIEEAAKVEAKKELVKEKAKKILKQVKTMTQAGFKPSTFTPLRPPRRLIIPKQNLPPRLQYIKPIPTEKRIDLKKLNPYLRDMMVQTIECNGPNENIVITIPSRKVTNIKLNEEEIDEVIKVFSDISRIPIHQGVFRVAIGNLVLSAIISEIIGTKFIIKKMKYPHPPTRRF